MPRKIGELFFELRTTSEFLKKDLAEGERQFGKFAEFVKANPIAAVTGLGLAFVGVAYQASQAAAGIDRQMRQVANVVGATAEEARALRTDLREVSLESGRSREELAGLFANIAKGGPGSAANVRALAEAALALSDALGVDVGSAANGLDLITDIFDIDPSRAKEVAAVLASIAAGKVPLDDVFAALQKIAPEATAIGLGFEDAAGFLVRFLEKGYSVKQVGSLFKEMADRGAEGRREIIALAGGAIDASKALETLAKKQDEATASAERQHEILTNKLHDQWLEFGNRVLPVVNTALSALNLLLAGTSVQLGTVGDGADKAMVGLLRIAEQQRLVTGKQQGIELGAGPKAPGRSPADDIGKRYADIVTATKRLEELSAKALRANATKLLDIINAPGAAQSTIEQAKSLHERVTTRLAAVLKKAGDDATKAEADFAKQVQDIMTDISRIVNDAEQKLREQQGQVEDALGRESGAREQEIKDLQAQTQALLEGAGAYDRVRIAQAADAAVRDARARKQEVNLKLTGDEEKAIREQVEQLARLRRISEALQSLGGKSPFDLGDADVQVGHLADDLSAAVGAASGLAAAFGEGGRALAGMLSQTSAFLAALSRVQKAGVFTDAAGKTKDVGFMGALSGKAGSAGIAAASGGALAVIGAGVAIADAVDLFGTRARKRAEELRQAAVEFNRSLEAFAIVSRTDLQQAITDNLTKASEIVNSYGTKLGVLTGEGAFKTVDEIIALREELDKTAKSGAWIANRKEVEALRDKLTELIPAVQANERELRKRIATEERIATEDAAVRRLVAEGRSAEASALRLWLEQQREVDAAQAKFGEDSPYLTALRATHKMETVLAEAVRRRVAVQQRNTDDDVFVGGDVQQRIQRWWSGFVESFGMGADILNGVDLSSASGLKGVRDAIVNIYKTLVVDGVDETEQAIIEYLKSILPLIDEAIADIGNAIDPIAQYFEAFSLRVDLFGMSIADQLNELKVTLSGAYGGALDDVLANVDLTSNAGRENFKNAISTKLAEILSDNVISEAEAPIFNLLKTLLGIANQAIDDAAAEAEAALAEADRIRQEAANQRSRDRDTARQRIDLFDLSGEAAIRATLDGYGEAFSNIFAQFDLTTIEGINAAQANIRALWESVREMSDEDVLRLFGMTRDEFIAALLDADNGLDGLTGAIDDVAKSALEAAAASREFSEEIGVEFLRSQGRNQEADVRLAGQRRDERLAKALSLGLGPEILAQIEAIYQKDLIDVAARYAEQAAQSIVGAATDAAAGAAGASASEGRSALQLVTDLGGLSEITAQSVAGLLREGVIAQQETARHTGAMLEVLRGGLPAPPRGLLRFAGGFSDASSPISTGGLHIGPITIHVGAVRADGMSPEQVGRASVDAILREIGTRATTELRFLGPNAA